MPLKFFGGFQKYLDDPTYFIVPNLDTSNRHRLSFRNIKHNLHQAIFFFQPLNDLMHYCYQINQDIKVFDESTFNLARTLHEFASSSHESISKAIERHNTTEIPAGVSLSKETVELIFEIRLYKNCQTLQYNFNTLVEKINQAITEKGLPEFPLSSGSSGIHEIVSILINIEKEETAEGFVPNPEPYELAYPPFLAPLDQFLTILKSSE